MVMVATGAPRLSLALDAREGARVPVHAGPLRRAPHARRAGAATTARGPRHSRSAPPIGLHCNSAGRRHYQSGQIQRGSATAFLSGGIFIVTDGPSFPSKAHRSQFACSLPHVLRPAEKLFCSK